MLEVQVSKQKGAVKMQIAICDDEKEFRDALKNKLIAYKREKRIQIDIYEFENGSRLLQSDIVFDMVFIDYQMPGLNGLETAKALRLKNCICSIIFITSYPEFVFESFEVQPFRFFIKPLKENDLHSALNHYLQQQKLLCPIVVVDEGERKTINSENILYLEGDGKYCIIRTTDNVVRSSKTLAKVQQELPQHCFYRIHRSYVVNMYCISSVKGNEILLINGEKALISRTHTADFKKVYKDFVKNYYIKV